MNFKKWDWCLVLELLQLLLLVIGVQGYPKQTKNVMTGSNVTLLPPRKHLGNYKRLTWLYTTKQKILEHENKTKYFNSTFKNRVKLDLESGALHIYEVWRRDSGVYYLRVYNEREEEWAINLTVWARSSGVTWIATWLVALAPIMLCSLLI
uniref:CD48 antigen n=1 Tax=Nannospalax galili TaxID=1026970 RepID=A0A8C6QQM5_NANGA